MRKEIIFSIEKKNNIIDEENRKKNMKIHRLINKFSLMLYLKSTSILVNEIEVFLNNLDRGCEMLSCFYEKGIVGVMLPS